MVGPQDKKEMVLHHIVTITLIYFSWAVNMVRVGSLVIVVHDIADPWLNVSIVTLIYSKTSLQRTSMTHFYNDAFSIQYFISLFVFVKNDLQSRNSVQQWFRINDAFFNQQYVYFC